MPMDTHTHPYPASQIRTPTRPCTLTHSSHVILLYTCTQARNQHSHTSTHACYCVIMRAYTHVPRHACKQHCVYHSERHDSAPDSHRERPRRDCCKINCVGVGVGIGVGVGASLTLCIIVAQKLIEAEPHRRKVACTHTLSHLEHCTRICTHSFTPRVCVIFAKTTTPTPRLLSHHPSTTHPLIHPSFVYLSIHPPIHPSVRPSVR